jgi:hypothetical protein
MSFFLKNNVPYKDADSAHEKKKDLLTALPVPQNKN